MEEITITSKDVGVLVIGEKELKMQRTVNGEVVETHGVYENEWKANGPALQTDGWSLVE